jgi:hypothetical protein
VCLPTSLSRSIDALCVGVLSWQGASTETGNCSLDELIMCIYWSAVITSLSRSIDALYVGVVPWQGAGTEAGHCPLERLHLLPQWDVRPGGFTIHILVFVRRWQSFIHRQILTMVMYPTFVTFPIFLSLKVHVPKLAPHFVVESYI